MADRRSSVHVRPPSPPSTTTVILHRIPPQTSTRFIGLLTLTVFGGVLLLLTSITITAFLIGLIVFAPLILLSSPIWVPLGSLLFVTVLGLLSSCGLGVASLVCPIWLYRYFKGSHPIGSDPADYACRRIYDTAQHVKEYARDYGGYLCSKLKDVAPGA